MGIVDKKAAAGGPVENLLPSREEKGKEVLQGVFEGFAQTEGKLRIAASRYSDNLNDAGGRAEYNVNVGVQTVVNTLVNANEHNDRVETNESKAMKESTRIVQNVTGPLLAKLNELKSMKTVDGPLSSVWSDVVQEFGKIIEQTESARAKEIIQNINLVIEGQVQRMRNDANGVSAESLKVQSGIGEERNRFDKVDFGESRGDVMWHRQALENIEDATRRNGEPLRSMCGSVVQELNGISQNWNKYVGEYFGGKE